MIGLLLACVGAIFNVLTDASRKKVLDQAHDAALISLWCKLLALVCYLLLTVFLLVGGGRLAMPAIGASLGLSQWSAFILYLLLNSLLEGTAIILNYRALQLAPLSLCVPFMALTPVFLLPAGRFFLHEAISGGMIIGVFMVLVGSLVMNRQLFAQGWLEPARAMIREKGSRYMLLVALLLTCTSVLDKWFVSSGGDAAFSARVSRSVVLAIGKCAMLSLVFLGLTLVRLRYRQPIPQVTQTGPDSGATGSAWLRPWCDIPGWLVAAGVFEAIVMVLQLIALQFAPAALIISIKRSGILLACGLGWFLFKERGITDRVIGSCVMLAGVLIFFLTKPDAAGVSLFGSLGALGVAGATLAGLAVALRMTRGGPSVVSTT
jgi:drug/metabolite transporter (DMT)-like permease